MLQKQSRAEDTKRGIVTAAERLFSSRGFEGVTMREIAEEAGCSHTAIYIYFKNKESLLHELSMPPLQALERQMLQVIADDEVNAEETLKLLSYRLIEFCLRHRSMYPIFFAARAESVDQEDPRMAVNGLRNRLFGLLRDALGQSLQLADEAVLLSYARIYFYTLHGIIATYVQSAEPLEEMKERLASTFDDAVDVLLNGFRHRLKRAVNR